MSGNPKRKKTHHFLKSERLCSFTFKTLLFSKGKSFFEYPFRVYWLTIDKNLEKLFHAKTITQFQGQENTEEMPAIIQSQNPSYPLLKVPKSALFHKPVKCLTGVSKRSVPSAVMRNRLKRLTREAYRQNKAPLYTFLDQTDTFLLLGFVYTAKQPSDYKVMKDKIIVSLQKIEAEIAQQTQK